VQPDEGTKCPFPGIFVCSLGMPAMLVANIFTPMRLVNIAAFRIRRQVPMCPAFGLTDYKVQGKTLSQAIVNLKDDQHNRGQDSTTKFCSRYVQVSRPQSWDGLKLLRRIEMKDLAFHPHPKLIAEMKRLQELEHKTLSSWEIMTSTQQMGDGNLFVY